MKEVVRTKSFIRWLAKLKDHKGKFAIAKYIEWLQDGHSGDGKYIVNGNGIQELRVGLGYRIYYIERDDEIIILLFGGNKDSQTNDIKQAKKILKEHEE